MTHPSTDPWQVIRANPSLLGDLLDRAGHDYLHDVQRAVALHARSQRRPVVTWQEALNDLTGATAQRAGVLRLSNVRCPACHGKGWSTRNVVQNLTRTGNQMICGECRGSRSASVTVQVRYAAPSDG